MMSDQEPESREPSAFSRRSIVSGSVISFRGSSLVVTGESIVDAIESKLTSSTRPGSPTGPWLTHDIAVIGREEASIVPLAWIPPEVERGDDAQVHGVLRRQAGELWSQVRHACAHRHGEPLDIDLDTVDRSHPYASELARTGARRADWWEARSRAIVLVVYGEPVPQTMSLMAIHVIPLEWVSDQGGITGGAKSRVPDLDWSWSDVVAELEGA